MADASEDKEVNHLRICCKDLSTRLTKRDMTIARPYAELAALLTTGGHNRDLPHAAAVAWLADETLRDVLALALDALRAWLTFRSSPCQPKFSTADILFVCKNARRHTPALRNRCYLLHAQEEYALRSVFQEAARRGCIWRVGRQ